MEKSGIYLIIVDKMGAVIVNSPIRTYLNLKMHLFYPRGIFPISHLRMSLHPSDMTGTPPNFL